VSDRAAQSLLCIGTGFKDFVREAVDAADLVLTVGYDIAEYAPDRWNPQGDKPIVHIDFRQAEVYTHYDPAVEVIGDIAETLVTFNRHLANKPLAMGDGGFLMNAQELETAKRVGAGFTSVVFNDNDYGLISWKQGMSRGRSVGRQLSNPDFVAFAASFGIQAYLPHNFAFFKLGIGLRSRHVAQELLKI
jgi:thiamine pyrophosphate-dependent acetolactate synthase large subunit-like protein